MRQVSYAALFFLRKGMCPLYSGALSSAKYSDEDYFILGVFRHLSANSIASARNSRQKNLAILPTLALASQGPGPTI